MQKKIIGILLSVCLLSPALWSQEQKKTVTPAKALSFVEKVEKFWSELNFVDRFKQVIEKSTAQNQFVLDKAAEGEMVSLGKRQPSNIKQVREVQEKLDRIQDEHMKKLDQITDSYN